MMTFNEYLEEKYPEFYEEAKKRGLLDKVLSVAKKMPLTAAAMISGVTGVGLSKHMAADAERQLHSAEVEKKSEKLPPLKPSKNKIVATIDDAGRA